ncbi:MAG: AbrB/MazE/SpoVT family DNA-binding domain-containing protein [Thermoplasmata archaeon]|nr:AbrB/MazE/SpoVT family DNA-binding domain-containing protein [Thermoplasmata archaeon]
MRIAKSVHYDKSRRVHVPVEIADALQLRPGIDRLFWTVEDGKIIIRKVSKQLSGPIEGCEDIEQRLRDYENHVPITSESLPLQTEVVIKIQ